MIEYKVYKNGTKHIVTFSYDDGSYQDYKLVEIFNKYGMKGTFHLNSNRFDDKTGGSVLRKDINSLYSGHECAVHSVDHPWLEKMPSVTVINQILENRKAIEKECGYVVRGMSYPFGTYSYDLLNTLKACGIVYSRTAGGNGEFNLPLDFMQWVPTCHHRKALALAKEFVKKLDNQWFSGLFYIWGHSFEFSENSECSSFEYIEEVCKLLSGHEDTLWCATNIEIYDYIMAQRALQVAADESFVYNPTSTDVWIIKDGQTVKIPKCEKVVF